MSIHKQARRAALPIFPDFPAQLQISCFRTKFWIFGRTNCARSAALRAASAGSERRESSAKPDINRFLRISMGGIRAAVLSFEFDASREKSRHGRVAQHRPLG
jgi:hypothetical protein